jgi:hypothetical protein
MSKLKILFFSAKNTYPIIKFKGKNLKGLSHHATEHRDLTIKKVTGTGSSPTT